MREQLSFQLFVENPLAYLILSFLNNQKASIQIDALELVAEKLAAQDVTETIRSLATDGFVVLDGTSVQLEEKLVVGKHGLDGGHSFVSDFRSASMYEYYCQKVKPGGSEQAARDWIVRAYSEGHLPSTMAHAVRNYASSLNDLRYARTAANFFALDGDRYHWQQYVREREAAPKMKGFEETFKDD
jgi:hypothetical protein